MFLKKEISGTVLNDIWNKYNIQADSMCAERLRVYAILRDTMLAEDVREIQWKLIHSKLHIFRNETNPERNQPVVMRICYKRLK